MLNGKGAAAEIEKGWESERWAGIERPYSAEDVVRLRGSVRIEYTLARMGAKRLWELMHKEPYVKALGALTGNQAVQQVKAGLKAIYLSGWQVAADANLAGHMYPDQSLYPANSVPDVVKRINHALQRADQIHHAEGKNGTYWFAPIVADAEAGFGGALNVFEIMKAIIEAGAAGVHFEDQLASEKKCGHMGGKVLIPTAQGIRNLISARLAADRSEEHTSELQSRQYLVCRLLLEKKKIKSRIHKYPEGRSERSWSTSASKARPKLRTRRHRLTLETYTATSLNVISVMQCKSRT